MNVWRQLGIARDPTDVEVKEFPADAYLEGARIIAAAGTFEVNEKTRRIGFTAVGKPDLEGGVIIVPSSPDRLHWVVHAPECFEYGTMFGYWWVLAFIDAG